MNYLLDTCLVSELVKPEPDSGVLSWLQDQPEERIHLSVITVGEIQAGIAKLPDSSRKFRLVDWLDNHLLRRFGGRLLSVDSAVAMVWGTRRGEAARSGVVLPLADALIAATAQANGMIVATRNVDDLARCGAMTINPWSS